MSHQFKSDAWSFVSVPKGPNSSPGQVDGSPSTNATESLIWITKAVERLG